MSAGLGELSEGIQGAATSTYAGQTDNIVWKRHTERNVLYVQFKNSYTGCTTTA